MIPQHPKIDHNGTLVHTTNSEGNPIHSTDDGVKAFHDWFGKSKAIDKHGRPQVMYHGTHADFDEFKPNPALGGLIFTSPDKHHAGEFSKANGANVKPVYIKAHNVYPKIIHAANEHKVGIAAKAKGYDAVRVQDHPGDVVNTAVMHPHQIKSVFNNGKWSSNMNKISESQDETTEKHYSLREWKAKAKKLKLTVTNDGQMAGVSHKVTMWSASNHHDPEKASAGGHFHAGKDFDIGSMTYPKNLNESRDFKEYLKDVRELRNDN